MTQHQTFKKHNENVLILLKYFVFYNITCTVRKQSVHAKVSWINPIQFWTLQIIKLSDALWNAVYVHSFLSNKKTQEFFCLWNSKYTIDEWIGMNSYV